jgi:type II secretory pathway component PulM
MIRAALIALGSNVFLVVAFYRLWKRQYDARRKAELELQALREAAQKYTSKYPPRGGSSCF